MHSDEDTNSQPGQGKHSGGGGQIRLAGSIIRSTKSNKVAPTSEQKKTIAVAQEQSWSEYIDGLKQRCIRRGSKSADDICLGQTMDGKNVFVHKQAESILSELIATARRKNVDAKSHVLSYESSEFINIPNLQIILNKGGRDAWFVDDIVNCFAVCMKHRMATEERVYIHTSWVISLMHSKCMKVQGRYNLKSIAVCIKNMVPTCALVARFSRSQWDSLVANDCRH